MSLSENIRKLRIKKNLSQEQLAAKLGITAQAVLKWETNETYPDGTLLVPLANELGASLDSLFDNEFVYMEDISVKIMKLINLTERNERFNIAREICWQIERGLFNCRMEIEKEYDPNELKNRKNSSYILDDNGFTVVSNGKEPFFFVSPQSEYGYGSYLDKKDTLQKIFEALSKIDTMNALIYLYHKTAEYIFEGSVLANACQIGNDKIDYVLEDLHFLGVINKLNVCINDEMRTLYSSRPNCKILALFIMAMEIKYSGAYCLQSDCRSTPFFKE